MWNEDGRSRWGYLKGEERLAREDAERMRHLDESIRRQANVADNGMRRCLGCHQLIATATAGDICRRCANREWMRANRKPMTREQMDAQNRRKREARQRTKAAREAENEERKRRARQEAAQAKLAARGIEVTP